jgi:hypothetical protein
MICCLQETHFTSEDTLRLKVKEWEKYTMQAEAKASCSSYTYFML